MHLENSNKVSFCLSKMTSFVGTRGFFFLIGTHDIRKLTEALEVQSSIQSHEEYYTFYDYFP